MFHSLMMRAIVGLFERSTPSTKTPCEHVRCIIASFADPSQVSHHQRMSMTSSLSLALRRRGESTLYLPPMGSPNGEPHSRYHPSPSRNEVAVVQPVLVRYPSSSLEKLSNSVTLDQTD